MTYFEEQRASRREELDRLAAELDAEDIELALSDKVEYANKDDEYDLVLADVDEYEYAEPDEETEN